MTELVNDLGRPISSPCPVGIFGDLCREIDYQSWRKLSIMFRRCLLDADWSKSGTKDLHAVSLSWLKSWIDPADIDSPVTLGLEIHKSITESDPDVKEGARFPPDLSWWMGGYDPSGIVYNDKTKELVTYIKSGKKIFDRAHKLGIITPKCLEEVEISEDTDVTAIQWIKPVAYIAGGMGILAFGVWAYSQIVRAMRSRDDA